MSLFDIFNKKNIGETLGSLMDTAKEQASGLTKAAPGGVGGLVGAGALGRCWAPSCPKARCRMPLWSVRAQ